MRRFSPRSIAVLATVGLGLLAGSADAFPLTGAIPRHPWPLRLETYGFGVVGVGDCILVRREVVDASNRVRLRLIKVCD